MRVLFNFHLALEFPDQIESRSGLSAPLPGQDTEIRIAHDDAEFLELLPQSDVLIAAPQPREVLDRAGRLRLHIIPFAGANRAPLEWYREHGVLLASSHGNAPVVAERAVALASAAAGRVAEFDRDLRQGRWHRRNDPVRPFDYWRSLAGAPTAILGTGAIGGRIAELVAPLVGQIIGYRRSPTPAGGPITRTVTSIREAIAGAAIVFVALPLTDETRGVLTRDLLSTTDRAVLVNVSRAETIPEEDLYRALTDGTLHSAGLDVWYRYPHPHWAEGPDAMPSSLPFQELPNVVLSPHAGSHTQSGKRGQLAGALDILEEYLKTGRVTGEIDFNRGY